jgi:hypothetical protein
MSLNKKIIINCPAGSGGRFCRDLIWKNFKNVEVIWVSHDVGGFEKDQANICIIRNPYDALASGIESGFTDTVEYQASIFNDIEGSTINTLPERVNNYNAFLRVCQNNDYITSINFELLINQPEEFLNYISKKFNLDFKKSTARTSGEDLKSKLSNDGQYRTITPRAKNKLREGIDSVIKNDKSVGECYTNYMAFCEYLSGGDKVRNK